MWATLYRVILDELGARGELDWSRCAVGSISLRAVKGELTGPNPVDRGKNGTKIHMITERTGLPISVAISAASTHDSLALEPLVRGDPADPLSARAAPPPARQIARRQDLRLPAPAQVPARTRNHASHRAPRHRVRPAVAPSPLGDRKIPGLAGGYRRLHRRYERRADHFASFVGLAAALMCYRRLTK
ncbi:hypothetical protein GCM10010404_68570 [Nonomuraea africana]